MNKKPQKSLKPISQRYRQPRWNHFLEQDQDGILHIEGVSVRDLQKKYGTPLYVIVDEEIRKRLRNFKDAFDYPLFKAQYACKCNSNLEILRIVREEGFEFDASSVGEIILGLLADFDPYQITFTNLFKTEQDIYFAATVGVQSITIDSIEELERTRVVAQNLKKPIPILLRVNPLIEEGEFTTKHQQYGIPYHKVKKAINLAEKYPYIDLRGFHYHGSYAYSSKSYFKAFDKVMDLVLYAKSKGVITYTLDFGGGFPAEAPKAYRPGRYFEAKDFADRFVKHVDRAFEKHSLPRPTIVFEPGKSIVATAGIGIMKVVSYKDLAKRGMLITNSSTYSMFPDVLVSNCSYEVLPATDMDLRRTQRYDIAGSTCDNIDIIASNRKLPLLEPNDLLAVMDCGAYSYVMGSNFNNLKRPPIVLIREDGSTKLVRRRDRYSDMFAPELSVLKIADPYELKKYYNLTRINLEKLWNGTDLNPDIRSRKSRRRITKREYVSSAKSNR